jgi:hypothetical protein
VANEKHVGTNRPAQHKALPIFLPFAIDSFVVLCKLVQIGELVPVVCKEDHL